MNLQDEEDEHRTLFEELLDAVIEKRKSLNQTDMSTQTQPKKRRIAAKFIGADGSMGFSRRETYKLDIWHDKSDIGKGPESIFVKGGLLPVVEYDTIDGFLNNWDNITNS